MVLNDPSYAWGMAPDIPGDGVIPDWLLFVISVFPGHQAAVRYVQVIDGVT
jgi:hypothetical protein